MERSFDYVQIPTMVQIIGEVNKPETINYRTFKPEMDGLFCEKIFGPVKIGNAIVVNINELDTNELLVCERCRVEVTESRLDVIAWDILN